MSDLANDTAAAPASDDLRASLSAAFDAPAQEGGNGSAPQERTDDRTRDDRGRFSPSVEPQAPEAPKPSEGVDDGKGTAQAATPPASWPKEKHELWAAMTPAQQEFVLQRESDVNRGFQERADRLKPYEEIDRAFQPFDERFARMGVTRGQAVQQLLAAQDFLDRDPVAAIRWLAQSFGVDASKLTTPTDPNAPQPNPELHALRNELGQVRHFVNQFQTAQHEQARAAVSQSIDEFRKANPHFDALRPAIANLLTSGQANDLAEAYEQAKWMVPDVRAKVMAEQQAAAQPKTDTAAIDKARNAGSSVRGAPTGPASSSPAAASSLREELERAFL